MLIGLLTLNDTCSDFCFAIDFGVISPNISKINQGETIQFSVYNYINEVKQSKLFKIKLLLIKYLDN